MSEQRVACTLVGKIRRFFLVHFHKDYVARQRRGRRGNCRQCGVCCHFSFACPMLAKNKLCLVYRRFRPKACRDFPIDQRDIDDVAACGGECGYGFDGPSGKGDSLPLVYADRPVGDRRCFPFGNQIKTRRGL